MGFHLQPWLPDSVSCVTYGVVGIVAAIVVIARLSRNPKLDAFPTVGPTSLLSSWWKNFKQPIDIVAIVQEGPLPFKIFDKHSWILILSNRDHIEELSRAPEDALSLLQAVNDQIKIHHTLGPDIHGVPYHIPVIRSQLTRNLGTIHSAIRDEIVAAFDDVLDLKGNEWEGISASSAVQKIICRTSSRLLVGLPLCRNPGWIDLNIKCTNDIIQEGFAIGLFPKVLQPMAARLFTGVAGNIKCGIDYLGPLIEERMKYVNEYGKNWTEKPTDLLLWLMEEAKGPQSTVRSLVIRMLFISFAAIHTSYISFSHALFYLAANPQYIQPLRDEVESIVEKEGWSKAALGKMHKVDSFLRECLRVEGTLTLALSRKALKDFRFSDGTLVPKGTSVCAASRSIQYDCRNYENAGAFDPFRFAEMHDEKGEGAKHQFVSTAMEYLPFGHGKHACPGRFFAANELKSMLAHLVVVYDVKLEDNAVRPHSLFIGTSIMPDPRAKVLFRKRVD